MDSATEEATIRAQALRYIAESAEYTSPYEREKILGDWLTKEHKAETLVHDFEKRAGLLKGRKTLELGFGNGLHIPPFARAGAEMHGLEVNRTLLAIGVENMQLRGIEADLRLYDGTHMPYEDAYFDYVFSTSVLEHVSDLSAVLSEIARVLKPGGAAYLSFPNRFAPRETHTGIWFLSYLPRAFAAVVLRQWFGRNSIEELNLHFLSYFTLHRLLRNLPLSVRFELDAPTTTRRFLKRGLAFFQLHHSVILKTIMVVLEKKTI